MVRHLLRDTLHTTREFSENARLFLVSTFLAWTGFSVNQVLFNLYLTEGGYGEEFVGRCVSLMGLGLGLAALPAGFLSDRIGRRASLVLGAAGLGLSLGIRSLTLDPALLLLTSFISGVSHALVSISAFPFMSENSESHVRTHLFSAHFAMILLAGVVGNLGGGKLPELLQAGIPALSGDLLPAYRIALVAGAAASLAAAWPLFPIREAPPETQPGNLRAALREGRRPMAKLALNYLLIGCGAGMIMPFFNLYFANRFGCTSGQIGLYFAASQVLTLFAALVGPRLASRFGILRTVTWLQLASLPFLVTLGLESHLWIAVGAFLARATLMQTSSPLENAFAMEVVPASLRARTIGLTQSLWFLGWAGSSAVAGWLLANVGYEWPYYITAMLYGLGAWSFWALFRRDPTTAAAEAMAVAKRSGPQGSRTSRVSEVTPLEESDAK